jgi:flagellar hook assembly protein FlgD
MVTLEIFNLTGGLIRTLVSEWKPAGTYVLEWDSKDRTGKEVPSGVYLLKLKAGDLATTRKLILLK